MMTYALQEGMTLVVVEPEGHRNVVTFHAGDFEDMRAASGDEVAAVLARAGVPVWVDAEGVVSLAAAARDGSLTVDVDASTAADALHLGAARDAAPEMAAAPAPVAAPRAPAAAAPAPVAPARGRKAGAGQPPRPAPAPPAVPAGGPSLVVHNLTASPIQLVMVTRTLNIPGNGSKTLSPAEAAHRPLQRLAESGVVRLAYDAAGKLDTP
jgi:hypothetical protein